MLRSAAGQQVVRVSLRELLSSDRAGVLPDDTVEPFDGLREPVSVLLAELTDPQRQQVLERAAHVREVLTGYLSGMAELAATRGAEQRIKRFLAIPGHHDLIHAANHLGVRKSVLAHQLDQLEHVVGATLLETQPDTRGITLTNAGAKFSQDATPVLAMLDQTGNGAPGREHCRVRRTTDGMPLD